MYSMQLTAVPLNAKSHDDPMQFEYLSLGCVAFSRDGLPEACDLWKQSYFGREGGNHISFSAVKRVGIKTTTTKLNSFSYVFCR